VAQRSNKPDRLAPRKWRIFGAALDHQEAVQGSENQREKSNATIGGKRLRRCSKVIVGVARSAMNQDECLMKLSFRSSSRYVLSIGELAQCVGHDMMDGSGLVSHTVDAVTVTYVLGA